MYSSANKWISEHKKELSICPCWETVTAGYLQRGTVAGDRRKVLLSCTEKAQPILKAGLEMQQDFNQKLTLDIPQKYMNIFKEITESMAVNAHQMLNK